MVRLILFLLACSLAHAANVGAVVPRDRWIAVGGSDANPGTPNAPWASTTPLNSTTLAPDAIVYLKGGDTFYLTNLAPTSSGTSGHPITFQSYGTGRAVLSGGTPVTTWTLIDAPNNIWRASFNSSTGRPRALWVNDRRIVRSRTTSLGSMTRTSTGWNSTFLASAAFPLEVEYHCKFAFWAIDMLQVTAVTSSTISLSSGVNTLFDNTYSLFQIAGGSQIPYEAENVYEVFVSNHTAGTFFQDRTNNFLYMVPPSGVADPNSATVVAGVQETVLTLANVHDVTLSNIQISHTTNLRPFSALNYIDGQTGGVLGADFQTMSNGFGGTTWNGTMTTIPAAVSIDTCARVKLSNVLIYQTSGIGVEVVGGSSAVEMDGIIASDLGGSAVQLGKPGFLYNNLQTTQPTLLPQPTGTNIHDSIFQYYGRDFVDHAGIIGWFYDALYFGRNLVHDGNYSPLALGWGFGYFEAGFMGGDLIELNEVYNGLLTRTDDGGGIYLNGINETTREIRFNYVHDITGTDHEPPAGKAGIYYDGGALRNNAHDNVVVNCQDWIWNVNTDDNHSLKDIPRGNNRNTLITTTADSTSSRADLPGVNTLTTPVNVGDSAARAAGVALGTGPGAAYSSLRTEAAALNR